MTLPQTENVGFIGLGNMGGPIALRLLRAGFGLTVLDLDREKLQPLREKPQVLIHRDNGDECPINFDAPTRECYLSSRSIYRLRRTA